MSECENASPYGAGYLISESWLLLESASEQPKQKNVRQISLSLIGLIIGLLIAIIGFCLCWSDCWHNSPTFTASLPHLSLFIIGFIISLVGDFFCLNKPDVNSMELNLGCSFSPKFTLTVVFLYFLFFLFNFL